MTMQLNKVFLLTLCLALSVLVHILCFYALLIFGKYDFSTPVNHAQWVELGLAQRTSSASSPEKTAVHDEDDAGRLTKDSVPKKTPAEPEPEEYKPETTDTATGKADKRENEATDSTTPGKSSPQRETTPVQPPLGRADEFLKAKYEKLTYLISIFGIPVGNAELEAKTVNSEVWITLRVNSNAVISNFYRVDNLVETRHIDGKFILTKIRQQEGTFKSDEWFTINLRKKRVSWVDNIGGRNQTVNVPTDDLFDTLSGIYFLRNRQLQVGKTETLHIFDSETYADVPVEIMHRETVRLPNLTTVDTLVVRPLQKSAGIFRRTGDILIWITDDAFKVPVKIVTSVALGTVTVELIAAESKPPEEITMTK